MNFLHQILLTLKPTQYQNLLIKNYLRTKLIPKPPHTKLSLIVIIPNPAQTKTSSYQIPLILNSLYFKFSS